MQAVILLALSAHRLPTFDSACTDLAQPAYHTATLHCICLQLVQRARKQAEAAVLKLHQMQTLAASTAAQGQAGSTGTAAASAFCLPWIEPSVLRYSYKYKMTQSKAVALLRC